MDTFFAAREPVRSNPLASVMVKSARPDHVPVAVTAPVVFRLRLPPEPVIPASVKTVSSPEPSVSWFPCNSVVLPRMMVMPVAPVWGNRLVFAPRVMEPEVEPPISKVEAAREYLWVPARVMDDWVLAVRAPRNTKPSPAPSPSRSEPVLLNAASPWKVVMALSNCRLYVPALKAELEPRVVAGPVKTKVPVAPARMFRLGARVPPTVAVKEAEALARLSVSTSTVPPAVTGPPARVRVVPVALAAPATWRRAIAPVPEDRFKPVPFASVTAPREMVLFWVERLAVSVTERPVSASPRVREAPAVEAATLPARVMAEGAVTVRPPVKVAVEEPLLPRVTLPVLARVVAPAMVASPNKLRA